MTLDPRARAAAVIIAISGGLIARYIPLLAAGWLVVLAFAFASGIIRLHLKFVFITLFPIAVALLLVWGWLVGAPPGSPVGSDHIGGMLFALMIFLRLAMLGGIIQLGLSTIPAERMPYTLSKCGIKGEGLIITLGALAVLPEIGHRADQVLTARFALGYVQNRTLIARARQLPYMLRPLFAWALRSAILRAENWRQRHIFSRIEDFSSEGEIGSIPLAVTCITLAAALLIGSIITRLMGVG